MSDADRSQRRRRGTREHVHHTRVSHSQSGCRIRNQGVAFAIRVGQLATLLVHSTGEMATCPVDELTTISVKLTG